MDIERKYILVLLCTCFTLAQAINGKIIRINSSLLNKYEPEMLLWLIVHSQATKEIHLHKLILLINR